MVPNRKMHKKAGRRHTSTLLFFVALFCLWSEETCVILWPSFFTFHVLPNCLRINKNNRHSLLCLVWFSNFKSLYDQRVTSFVVTASFNCFEQVVIIQYKWKSRLLLEEESSLFPIMTYYLFHVQFGLYLQPIFKKASGLRHWPECEKRILLYMENISSSLTAFNPPFNSSSQQTLGSLNKGVFERRTSTGSEVFLTPPNLYFLASFIIETICPKIWGKISFKNEKSSLPVDLRSSKTSSLQFTIDQIWKKFSANGTYVASWLCRGTTAVWAAHLLW